MIEENKLFYTFYNSTTVIIFLYDMLVKSNQFHTCVDFFSKVIRCHSIIIMLGKLLLLNVDSV